MKNFLKCLFNIHSPVKIGGNWYQCLNCKSLGKENWYDPYDEDGNSPFIRKYIEWGLNDYQLEIKNKVRQDMGLEPIVKLK